MSKAQDVFKRIVGALGIAVPVLIRASDLQALTGLDVQRMVVEEAMRGRVPPALPLAVAKVESDFEPAAESPVGARGVMQLLPKTARDVFGVHEAELWNPRVNIRLGVDFLAQLYSQYGERWDLALSHYNGGTLTGGAGASAKPHDFTRKYVADVLRWQRYYETPGALRIDFTRHSSMERPRSRAVAPQRRVDPIEFDTWADMERRRIEQRRELDDFARRR